MQPSCPYCGSDLDLGQARPGSQPGTVLCPTCGQELDRPGPALDAPPPQETGPAPHMPAWEGEGGFFRRILRTTGQVLGRPGRFFAAPAHRGYAWSLSYGLIVGTFSAAAQTLWSQYLASRHVPLGHTLWGLIFTPLIILVGLFLSAWVLHFFLFIVGGAKKGVQATFRVVAYTEAVSLFMVLPVVGVPISFVWGLVSATAGLAAAHGISRGRAFLALVLPVVVLIALVVGAVVLVIALGVGAEIRNYLRGLPGI